MASLKLKTGIADNSTTHDILKLRDQLGVDVSTALIGYHAFTGCDTTSAFRGKGKKAPFELMRKKGNEKFLHLFSRFGNSHLSGEDIRILEEFTCRMYDSATECTDINVLRANKFDAKHMSDEKLPPNQNSLEQHIKRAYYQARLWRTATVAIPIYIFKATDYGYVNENNCFTIQWVTDEIACSC